MTRAELLALENEIATAWRALLSSAEAERIGPTTLLVMAHEAAKAALAGGGDE
jgi:hypothetical protein